MTRRFAVPLLIVLTAGTVFAAGQDAKYRAPRTDSGQPDLQGVWNFDSAVPLQRPGTFADKKFFTKDELERYRTTVRNAFGMLATFAPVEAVGIELMTLLDTTPRVEDLRTSLITYPENGRLPALVPGVTRMPGADDFIAALSDPKGAAASLGPLLAGFGAGKKDSYRDFTTAERCLVAAPVPLAPQLGDNYMQIIQTRDHVVLVSDSARRLVKLNGTFPASEGLRTWSGTSVGHWEGDTLVVDTRHFNNRTPSFAGAGNSHDKVVTERFTRVAANVIQYAATIVDPKTFRDRIDLSFPMGLTDGRIYEETCHEGNYSLPLALSGARKEDETKKTQRQRAPRQELTVLDRSGAVVARIGQPGLYAQAAFSPDGRQVAVVRTDVETGNPDVWIFDVATGRGHALTSDAAVDSTPVWSPDGKRVAYASARESGTAIVRRAVDGAAPEEVLYRKDAGAAILTDWSRDGRFLAFWSNEGMFILPVTATRQAIAIGDGRAPRFSPDGHWLAYNGPDTGQAGRFHTFLRPFDAAAIGPAVPSTVRRVSETHAIGGISWRSDGKELYFLSQAPPAAMMMAADIGAPLPASPKPLFQAPPALGAVAQLSSISSPDGQRFLFAVTQTAAVAARETEDTPK
jgi:hypothetical protein